MYTLTDKLQFQASTIILGKHKLAAVHQEIIDWITIQFGVRALDFACETRTTAKGLSQQLIHVVLETAEDVKKIQTDHTNTQAIHQRFLKYLASVDHQPVAVDPLKLCRPTNNANTAPDIVVTYRPLKSLSDEMVKEMLDDERRTMLEAFDSVWTISQNVVFYFTDAQMKENLENGISEKITEALVQVDDKYGFVSKYQYNFDSKESFDRDYDGKWHYYWK